MMSRPFIPHDYQHESIDWLTQHRRCGLFAAMGSGKSVSTLTALEQLDTIEQVYPALVLAPLRVANSTWPDECAKWNHLEHLRVSPIAARKNPNSSASAADRLKALNTPADIYTLPYDNLEWLVAQCGSNWPFRTVVADEATRTKNFRLRQGGKRAGALAKVAHTAVHRYIALTGTPAANGLKDLWGQMWFLDQGKRLGRTYSAFEQRWFRKGWDGFSVEPMAHAQKEIQDLISDLCLTVSGLDVDEPIEHIIYVDLPPAARKLYNAMEREFFATIEREGVDGVEVEASNAAVKASKLLQIASGAVYHDDESNWQQVHDEKLVALESIYEEAAGASVLVAYQFKHDLERLRKSFRQAKALGADPQTIRDWNAGKVPLLLAHPACLHPSTEVLTEYRGWVPLVEVLSAERVYDGVEFVSHKGCFYSGTKPVTTLFGLTLTPDHKLLVGDTWIEARDVRDFGSVRRKARYQYAGADPYLGAMLPLRDGANDSTPKRAPCQSTRQQALSRVCGGNLPPDDRHSILAHLEGDEGPRNKPGFSRLPTLWRSGTWCGRIVADFRELLQRHAPRLRRPPHDRARRQHQRILQSELPMGNEHGATVQQREQPGDSLPRPQHALGGVLPRSRSEPRSHLSSAEPRDDRRRGVERLRSLDVQERPEATISAVYDLVDCGPRHRFLIRNAGGEVFISHNSAGHGLNLADGGSIMADFSLGWNLEYDQQIIERIGPMRQKQAGYDRPVYRYRIVARDTMDEVVLERLRSKRTVQDVLLAALKARKV